MIIPLQATVLIPTHDHWYTLPYAIESASRQTLEEIEILVVGDGVPDATRELLEGLLAEEPRLRFFDHPKGERHGERHRARALEAARGRIVCYLSDDDLWLPDHLETMAGQLEGCDFAAGLAAWLDEGGGLHFYLEDLSLPFYRNLLLGGENRVPLSCGAHTLASYRALPAGWAPAPREVPTDLYMWQRFLADPACRAASALRPTVLHFPSPLRRHLTSEQRAAELQSWSARLGQGGLRDQLLAGLFEAGRRGLIESEIELRATRLGLTELEQTRRELEALRQTSARLEQHGAEQARALARLEEAVELETTERRLEQQRRRRAEEERGRLEELLERAFSTATWRLRERLIRLPVLGRWLRRLASAAARRVAS